MAAEEQPSMDDTIAETYQAIIEREKDSPEPGAPLEAADTSAGAPKEEKADRARDESGRFVEQPKEAKQEKPEAPKAAKPDEKTPSATGKAPEEAKPAGSPATPAAEPSEPVVRADGKPADLNRPPAEWKPGAKAEWAKLPESVRAEIHRREVDAFKKFSEFAPDAEFGRNMRSLGDKYHQVIALDGGGDLGRAVGAFFQTASVLRFGTPVQKRQAIDYLEQNYGVPAKQAQVGADGQTVGQPAAQPHDFRDPRVDSIQAMLQQQEQARRSESDRIANDATTRFLGATNDKGEPLYPFVDNVLEDMTARVQSIRARSPGTPHDEALKQAYESAVWANPETRKILQEQEVLRLEAQRREENLRKVESARKAGAGNVTRKGTPPAQAPVGTMDDTILQTYREITSR